MASELHSVVAAADVLEVSKWTVYRLIASGDLDTVDVAPSGSRRAKTRVPAESLAAFIASRRSNAKTLRTR